MGTQRYISATKKEGINLNYTGVRRALGDLGIVQKCPSCAQGSMVKITKNAKKYDDISKLLLPFKKKKKIAVGFQDEKWVELLPKAERCWLPRGKVLHIPTLGYNKRVNCFITLFLPKKNIVWNTFSRRRNIEFRKHLSNLVAYAKRRKLKR